MGIFQTRLWSHGNHGGVFLMNGHSQSLADLPQFHHHLHIIHDRVQIGVQDFPGFVLVGQHLSPAGPHKSHIASLHGASSPKQNLLCPKITKSSESQDFPSLPAIFCLLLHLKVGDAKIGWPCIAIARRDSGDLDQWKRTSDSKRPGQSLQFVCT